MQALCSRGKDLPNREYVLVRFALRNGGHLRPAVGIAPLAQQFTLFHVPAENFFVGPDYCPPCACAPRGTRDIFVSGPDRIRRGGGDEAKSLGMLEFPAIVSAFELEIRAWETGEALQI